MPRVVIVLIAAAVAMAAGGVLAYAFNPDDGALAHVEAVWRVGGLMVYAGVAVDVLLLLYAVGRALGMASWGRPNR